MRIVGSAPDFEALSSRMERGFIESVPFWVVLPIGLLLLWIFIPLETIWRCRKCGRVAWDDRLKRSAFCKRCGTPRPRGPAGEPVPLTFTGKPGTPQGMTKHVTEILTAERMADALPAGTSARALVIGTIAEGSAVADAHPTWRREFVGEVAGLPPFPQHPADALVPAGIVLVEIEAMERPSGGMSSHFQFEGLFVSVLVSLPEARVWDVRACDAT